MDKSPEAFRTISEVADVLETPAHVLRFWESRFPQIRPVKRAGGRRYYRPSDVALLGGIRHLLHDQGMTIRGVQKVLREQGVRHVASLAGALAAAEDEAPDDEAFAETLRALRAQSAPRAPESAEILDLSALSPRSPNEPPPSASDAAPGAVLRLHPAPSAPSASPQGRADAPAPRAAFPRAPEDSSFPPPRPSPLPEAPETGEAEDVPEAGHVWVEDEPELDLPGAAPRSEATPPQLFPRASRPARPPESDAPGMFDDVFAPGPSSDQIEDAEIVEPAKLAPRPAVEAPLMLSGLAARIRALPQPLSPEAALELTDLHNRLGLLHAQIAEALRGRR